MKQLLKTIQQKATEAITEEIRNSSMWEGRTKFIEFQPIAEYNGIEIDVYQDEVGKVEILLWKAGEEHHDDELEKKVYDALPDWDLVRCDVETDGISRYGWCDPAFSSIDDVNGMFYKL